MNTEEITFLLSRLLAKTKVNFLGVFPSDKLPTYSITLAFVPCCYVANVDPTGQQGSHWVAFYHSCPNKLDFFDSFGRDPKEFGFSFHKLIQIQSNKTEVQSLFSSQCGQFCIYFLFHRALGFSLQNIISRFNHLSKSSSELKLNSFISHSLHKFKRK